VPQKKLKKADWRSRPRKPAASRKVAKITLRVTAAEKAEIEAAAAAGGLNVSEYLISRALHLRRLGEAVSVSQPPRRQLAD